MPVLDDCMLKIIEPIRIDIKVLHIIIQKLAPDKSAEIFKIMQTP